RPVSGGCVRFAVLVLSRLPAPTLFPYTTLFRSNELLSALRKTQGYDLLLLDWEMPDISGLDVLHWARGNFGPALPIMFLTSRTLDRKSTRLNSSHVKISYAVFCLKKKKVTRSRM